MALDNAKLDALLGRVVGDVGAAMSAVLVLIGDRLGLYKALAKGGPGTPVEIARRAGLHERMVREWLLNQAAGGYIEHVSGGADGAPAVYRMTEEQAFVFANDASPADMGGAFEIITSVHRDWEKILGAFKSGKGLPWGAHEGCLFCGTERFFAANYRGNLIDSWIPALDGAKARFDQGAIVADLGCGHGASTLLMAKAFPNTTFVGFDFHQPSIECARRRAAEAGVSNTRFEVADSTNFPGPGPAPGAVFDAIMCFDCLHDMGDPKGCAAQVCRRLKPDGWWMVVEPAAADSVAENLNPVGRVFSAASTTICVPASLAFDGPALGACAGEAKLREVITSGGFRRFRRAASTPFNMVLEARP